MRFQPLNVAKCDASGDSVQYVRSRGGIPSGRSLHEAHLAVLHIHSSEVLNLGATAKLVATQLRIQNKGKITWGSAYWNIEFYTPFSVSCKI